MASISGDEGRSIDTLSLIAEHYGDDESLQFILLDHYHYTNEHTKAITGLELMAAHMGIRDGVNWGLSSFYYQKQGDYDNAISAANKSIEQEPDVDLAYLALLGIYNEMKQFDDVVSVMKALEERFPYDFSTETLSEAPDFQDLIASQAFKDWERTK